MRQVNRYLMGLIREKVLEEKFTTKGAREYDYKPRTKGYQIKKATRRGHTRPLEYTGELKDTMLASAKITATATRGKLRCRTSFPLTPERRRELESISTEDDAQILAAAQAEYARLANLPENRTRTRRRRGAGTTKV